MTGLKTMMLLFFLTCLQIFGSAQKKTVIPDSIKTYTINQIERICGLDAAKMVIREDIWYAYLVNGVYVLPAYLDLPSDTVKARVLFKHDTIHFNLTADLIITSSSSRLYDDNDKIIDQEFGDFLSLDDYYISARKHGMSKKYQKSSASLTWHFDSAKQSCIPSVSFKWIDSKKRGGFGGSLHYHYFIIDASDGQFIEKRQFKRPRINVTF